MAIDENPEQHYQAQAQEPEERRSSVGICGFLELAIHQLLYVKKVYLRKSFKKVYRKNIPTWICQTPSVKKYILDFLDFAHGFLVQQEAIRVVFVLKERSGVILEQFFFEVKVKDFEVESEKQLMEIVDNLIPVCKDINEEYPANFEECPEDITFELQVRVKPPSVLPKVNPNFAWVMYSNDADVSEKVNPIKAEENHLYKMKAYVYQQNEEDGKLKANEKNAIKVVQKPGEKHVTVLHKPKNRKEKVKEVKKAKNEILEELLKSPEEV